MATVYSKRDSSGLYLTNEAKEGYTVYIGNFISGTSIYIEPYNGKFILPGDTTNFFSICTLAEPHWEAWDLSECVSLNSLFYKCKGLTTVDMSGWDLSKVTNMHAMFYQTDVKEIILGEHDLSKVTNVEYMFFGNTKLENILVPKGTDWKVDYPNMIKNSNLFTSSTKLPNYDDSNSQDINQANTNGGYFGGVRSWNECEIWLKDSISWPV